MNDLPRTLSENFDECTFLASMALNNKDYHPKPIEFKDNNQSSPEIKIPQATEEEASEKSSDHEDADPLTDEVPSMKNGF